MSLSLLLFTIVVVAGSLLAIVRPSQLFTFPVIGCLLMLVFIVPQCWIIEQSGSLAEFEPETTWSFMLLCTVVTFIGFHLGTRVKLAKTSRTLADYDVKRLSQGALLTTAIGFVGYVLMLREVIASDQGSQWTGVITVYALMANLIPFGTALAWIVFLRRGGVVALGVTIFGAMVALVTVLLAARREVAFAVVASILLGLVFGKRYHMPRTLIIVAAFAGGIFVNETGTIRTYMSVNKVSMPTAIVNVDLLDFSKITAEEVSCAVTDIAIAKWNNQYSLLSGYYNTLVQLYFPAIIFGREAKNNAKVYQESPETIVGTSHVSFGATRTGFSAAFVGFHSLGAGVFLLIAYMLGRFWKRASLGDIEAQFFYIALLPSGLKVFTESPERFVGALPFTFGSMMVIFLLARLRRGKTSQALPPHNGDVGMAPVGASR